MGAAETADDLRPADALRRRRDRGEVDGGAGGTAEFGRGIWGKGIEEEVEAGRFGAEDFRGGRGFCGVVERRKNWVSFAPSRHFLVKQNQPPNL